MELSSSLVIVHSLLDRISFPFLIVLGVCLVFLIWNMRHMGFYVKAGSVFLGIMMVSLVGIPLYLIWIYILRRDADEFQVKYVGHMGGFMVGYSGFAMKLKMETFGKMLAPVWLWPIINLHSIWSLSRISFPNEPW